MHQNHHKKLTKKNEHEKTTQLKYGGRDGIIQVNGITFIVVPRRKASYRKREDLSSNSADEGKWLSDLRVTLIDEKPNNTALNREKSNILNSGIDIT